MHQIEIEWIKSNAKRYAQQQGISEREAEKLLAQQAFRQVQFGVEGEFDKNAYEFLRQAPHQLLPGDPNIPGQNVGYMFFAPPDQKANPLMYLDSALAYTDFYKQNDLKQPTEQGLAAAAQKDAQVHARLTTATKAAFGASAAIALAGLTPTLLDWALTNPEAASKAGIITAETAAAIVSGAVMPTGLLQQVTNPATARVVYNRLAAAATQNASSSEVVLGSYLSGQVGSYEKIAQQRGSTYYQVAAWDNIANELGNQEKMWEFNKAFLQQSIDKGKSFVFTTDPSRLTGLSGPREYQFLLDNGFQFKQGAGGLWYGTKK